MNEESAFRRCIAAIKRESGFTLIEMMVAMVLLGILTAAFADTFSASVNRSSQVQSQNIAMTEVSAALNQFVADFRAASYGDGTTTPIITYSANSLSFYSPDRILPYYHMRRITYSVQGASLIRQVTTSTNTSQTGPPWSGVSSDAGPTSTLFSGLTNPTTIFQYCGQNTAEMALAPGNPTSPQPITWQCNAPSTTDLVNTVVVNVAIEGNPTTVTYNYGAVATLRSSANQAETNGQTGASS